MIQRGKKGFYPTKKIKQWIYQYSNGTRKFCRALFSDGCEIELGKPYRGLSIDFLMNGGDDFKSVIGNIYTLRK